MQQNIPTGNVYPKYASKNPLARWIVDHFLAASKDLLSENCDNVKRILELGCGEGELASRLKQWFPNADVHASDISPELIEVAQKNFPDIYFFQRDLQKDLKDLGPFDLVVLSEVLEHLENPGDVLQRVSQIPSRYFFFSVPREPLWRILNVCRGKYLQSLGNTPGHLQHWSSSRFVTLISHTFRVIEVKKPLPWTAILAEGKSK